MIRAAGGVVERADGRIAVVHRPRHDDWSLPKGKLDPGEDFATAALREVQEETGVRAALGRELPPTEYAVRGKPKLVRWWRMTVLDEGAFAPDDEVDELRWCTRAEAAELLNRAGELSG